MVYFAMGKEGLEPSRLAAHDPKSCLSANSSISPVKEQHSGMICIILHPEIALRLPNILF